MPSIRDALTWLNGGETFTRIPKLQFAVDRTASLVATKLRDFGCDEVVTGNRSNRYCSRHPWQDKRQRRPGLLLRRLAPARSPSRPGRLGMRAAIATSLLEILLDLPIDVLSGGDWSTRSWGTPCPSRGRYWPPCRPVLQGGGQRLWPGTGPAGALVASWSRPSTVLASLPGPR